MKDLKNIFEIQASDQHLEKIKNSVEEQLKINRRQQRRKFLSWLLVPSLASLAALIFWRRPSEEPQLQDVAFVMDLEEEDLEILSENEFEENLELLEEWDEHSET